MSTVQQPSSQAGRVARRESLLQRANGPGWLALLWFLLALVLLVQLGASPSTLAVGRVSPVNVRAPETSTYLSALRTERERERAAAAVEPIFSPPNRSQAIEQVGTADAVARFLDAVRADPYASEERKIAYIGALQDVQFDADAVRLILSLPEAQWRAVVDETRRVVDSQMRAEIRENRLPTILRNLPNQISPALSDEQAQVVSAWAGALITPNTLLDSERTEQARLAAREAVAPVEWHYEAGQIVVREGEVVTAEQAEALEQMGLLEPEAATLGWVGTGLFLFFLVLLLGLYLSRVHPEHFRNPRVMGLIVLLLASLTLGARIVMPDHVLLRYLLPTSAAAMLLGGLLGVDLSIVITVLLSLIIGYLTGSTEMISYTFVGGLLAALVLWRVERLGAFVWTGVIVGLANVGIVLVFALQAGIQDWIPIAAISGMALLNGAASASLALAGFYVLSNLLGQTTFLQLMELARPTHPLFRELLLKAPGTYNHSIIVSNLAEGAAEAVGADMFLVRVGAYYHDVGKVQNPHYFVENQSDGVNLHDALDDPYQSAEIILEHVAHGLQLARRYKLPSKLTDFIAQHHGTTSVAWFYHRACEREGEARVDDSRFRYPGPKPQSREAAILMLADTVEATARAVKPAGAAEIDSLIRKVIATKLAEGQLDECELNLRDLDAIRRAFIAILQGIYHPRIAYPEAKQANPLPAPPDGRLLTTAPDPQEKSHVRPAESHPGSDRPAVGSTR